MKLIQKTRGVNLLFSAIILVISGFALFFILRMVILDEIDEQLQLKAERLIQQVERGALPNDPLVQIDSVAKEERAIPLLKDTVIFNPKEQENEIYRQLSFSKSINNQTYGIKILTLLVEWEDLILVIFGIFVAMSILLLVSSFVVNSIVAKRIWSPFFQNLSAVKSFSVKTLQPLHLRSSDINEFAEMNAVLTELTERVRKDYNALREFTENASHESQTPLAIIQSKLDRLSQHAGMDKQMAESITAALSAADRLSKLNRNLLLLAKLENQQFELQPGVYISALLNEQVNTLHELFEAKKMKLSMNIQEEITVKANKALCEILISNLLSNILRYTPEGGSAELHLTKNEFSVCNSGEPLNFSKDDLFSRFKKGEANSSSNGLGLAIVKEIVTLHHWQIEYAYDKSNHCFRIYFPL